MKKSVFAVVLAVLLLVSAGAMAMTAGTYEGEGNGIGGPGYSIRGEFARNGFDNPLKHTRGVLSMARSMMPNSAGSQFFIMVDDAPHLDGQYAAFGKVTEGMETADAIVAAPRDRRNDKPYEYQKIKSVRVETFGVEYKAEKLKISRF